MNANKVDVEIYNLIGQKVLDFKNYKLEENINISNLNKGTYLVRITSEDQESIKRLIKN
jgi:hypothetical protein